MILFESIKSLEENSDQHTDVLTEELEESSKQHTEMLPEEEEALRPYIFNSCVNVSYVGKGGQQMENVKEANEEETMLAESIVKDHHSIMMIGTMEITMEVVEAVNKKNIAQGRKHET